MISFSALNGLAAGGALKDLTSPAFRDLQRALAFLTYSPGKIDGAYGANTASAWTQFRQDLGETANEEVSGTALASLAQRSSAFDTILAAPALDKAAVQRAIVEACKVAGLILKTQQAYVLATAEHETNATFEPVREAYWVKNAEAWRKTHLAYWPYYGRGYVQLTWEENYDNYGRILGIDLVSNPDLALDHYGATFVLVQGFKTGAFTHRKLAEFVNARRTDFVGARYCINGQDRADHIAGLANAWLSRL